MKILHVIAQKPESTGSGVYARQLIKEFNGFEQALVAGIDIEDRIDIDVEFYPVVFGGEEPSFPVVGMSDKMPYESTKYRDLNEESLRIWKKSFKDRLLQVKVEFNPDIIITHHLYLLTSIVREVFVDQKVVGVCHATDIRQISTHNLEREYIMESIPKLDKVMALHEKQKNQIIELFGIEAQKIEVIGLAYDRDIFNFDGGKDSKIEVWYVGKVSHSKGVGELIEAFGMIEAEDGITLKIAGGVNGEEGNKLAEKAANSSRKIDLLGLVDQKELASKLKKGHILVLPSYYEGFPMVVVEALACGMKVIVNDLPGLREGLGKDIVESKNIYFIEMPKLEGIDKIEKNARDKYIKNLTKSIEDVIAKKEPVREICLKKFSWIRIKGRYIEVIESI